MEVVIMIAQVLLALSILIILHEWGHFFAARKFGIKVEKFYLFFDAWGKKLFSFKKGDTEYGVGWLPLGGYVKIAGMVDESMDKEQMKEEPQDWEFRSKPAWQRLIVMVAGVVVNLILGVVILWFMTAYYGETRLPMKVVNEQLPLFPLGLGDSVGFEQGDKILSLNGIDVQYFEDLNNPKALLADEIVFEIDRNGEKIELKMPERFLDLLSTVGKDEGFLSHELPFKVGELSPGSAAEKGGLLPGDRIVGINGKPINGYNAFKANVTPGKVMTVEVESGKALKTLEVTPDEDGILGFQTDMSELESFYEKQEFGFWESLPIGFNKGVVTLGTQIKGFGKLFSGELNPRKSLMGPIQLAKVFGGTWNWQRFWSLTAMFSLVLAFMNILPIPALDGGHALFCIAEMVTGKTLNDKVMQYVQMAGMIILLTLMVFIFGNDILRLMGI